MAIESKNLLVWVKAMSRGQALPLDASEIYDSYAAAQEYLESPIAYAGQTIKALKDDGKYHEYVIQPSNGGYTLEEVGAVSSEDLKQYVMIVEELPENDREQGILYINTTDLTGNIWNGSNWVTVFTNVSSQLIQINESIDQLNGDLDAKAPIENPIFSGTVKVGDDELAAKSYVDALFAQLGDTVTTPGVADTENGIPAENYTAGQMWRVSEAGTYVGQICEPGDLIICLTSWSEGTASNDDFMVVQANIDGAVTSATNTATVGEIVVFNSVTGKVIGKSGVEIASLEDAIDKAHEHENKEILDSYNLSQTDLLASAATNAQNQITTAVEAIEQALEGKANKATTLEGYGIMDAYTQTQIDSKLEVITENLNTKITATEVDTKIATAKNETLEAAAVSTAEVLSERIGDIPESTSVREYVDNAIGSGGTSSAEAIAKAKAEAIETSQTYTDTKLQIIEF